LSLNEAYRNVIGIIILQNVPQKEYAVL